MFECLSIGGAYWLGARIDLTTSEFKIVHCLMAQAGTDVSYQHLYEAVRGEGFVVGYGTDGYRSNVRHFVKRIRDKFRDVDPEFDRIENYHGFGYCWRDDQKREGSKDVLQEVE